MRQRFAVAVVLVGDGVDDGHGPGQSELQPLARMRPGPAHLLTMNWLPAPQYASDDGYLGHVAVGPNAQVDPAAEVDTADALQEAAHEVLPRLLTVRDDVDASGLLQFESNQHRVALALPELLGWQPPRGP